jgi:hypothetical protein
MSLTTSPFGTPVTDAPAPVAPALEEAAPSNRRNLVILGGVAGALAVGAGAYFLLFAGGSDPEVTGAAVLPRTPRVVASAPATAPAAPPIKKYVSVKARNPFAPLVSVPVAAAAPAGGTTTGVTGGTTAGTSGITVGTTGGSTTGSTGGSGTTPTAVPAPQIKVALNAVSDDNTAARIRVAGKTYTVKPLEEFGTYFKLLNLRDGSCGAVQYGDIVFDICEGGTRTLR